MNVIKNGQSENALLDIDQTDNKNSSELIKREEIEDSPFMIIETERDLFGVMGEYRLTEVYEVTDDNRVKLREELKAISWNRVIQVIMLLVEKLKDKDINELLNEEKR